MREIKFRGRSIDGDETVYGSILSLPNCNPYIISSTYFSSQDTDPKHFAIINDWKGDYPIKAAVLIHQVKPDSVAQLIGYDHNNKEVYEDDELIDVEDRIVVNANVALQMWDLGDKFVNYILEVKPDD